MEWLGVGLLVLGLLALAGMYGWDYYQRRQRLRFEQERVLPDLNAEVETVGAVRSRTVAAPIEPKLNFTEAVEDPQPKPVVKNAAPEPPVPTDWIIQVSLVCQEPGGYLGDVVMQALDEVGLEYGAMRIFHRQVEQPGKGRELQFSVANLVKPGYFIPEDAAESFIPGLFLFLRLPGPHSPLAAFNDMMFTLEKLQNLLGGELRDNRQQILTPDAQVTLREQVVRFERQQQRRA